MIFFNSKQQQQPMGIYNRTNQNNMLMARSIPQVTARTQQQSLVQQTAPLPPEQKSKEMRWGAPTWFLFHTLAEKVKAESFPEIRIQLFDVINTICANLPCPKCSSHAIEYMKKVNFNAIVTKRDLQLLMYRFHNEVNNRKGFQEFDQNELTDKYSKANTTNIIHNFFYFFQEKSKNVSMISLNLYRDRIVKELKQWFQKNIQSFDL
jgi:hypothetical protein